MRNKWTILIMGLCLGLAVQAETSITYQGQLQDSGGPVTDTLEMVFRLFDDATGTNQIGSDIIEPEVAVTDGLFQVELDFGDVYSGARWLEVEVAGTTLEPRQRIAPAPLAIRALSVPEGTGGVWIQDGVAIEYFAEDQGMRLQPFTDESFGEGLWSPQLTLGHANNLAGSRGATVSGGGISASPNRAVGNYATVGGGWGNEAGDLATVSGGQENVAEAPYAAISGGWANSAAGDWSTVPGGRENQATGNYSIAAGRSSAAMADYATIGGGGPTDTSDIDNTKNRVYDNFGTIGGGGSNQAGVDDGDPTSAQFATIGGGVVNIASGFASTVGGGLQNTASGAVATVGGGQLVSASGAGATVAGGFGNSASGEAATVPGGLSNEASGNHSFAAGRRAMANHDGSFVWSDYSTTLDFPSTGENQFLIRAAGGVGINTNDPAGFDLAVNGDASVGTLQLNTLIGTGSETLCRGTNNFVSECTSSGNYKEEVSTVEQGESRILRLNPVHFSWKETGTEDMGLIAEEVAEVEPRLVNRDESGTVTGVRYRHLTALLISAVQEQAEAMENDRQRLAALETENAELRQLAERNAELEERLAALENLLLDDRAVAVGQ